MIIEELSTTQGKKNKQMKSFFGCVLFLLKNPNSKRTKTIKQIKKGNRGKLSGDKFSSGVS